MGLIHVVKYHGQVVPKDYMTKVYATAPAYFGCAVADKDEKGNQYISTIRDEKVPPIEEVLDLMNAYKDHQMVMCFGDKPTLQEDWQPLDLISDKLDKNVCVGFISGEFPGFVKKGSSHEPAFHAMVEGVRPKLLEVYDSLSAELSDFSDELGSKVLERKLNDLSTSTAAIIVLTAAERSQGFIKGMSNAHEEPWGFTTDNLEKKAEPVKETPAAEPKKPASLLDRVKQGAASIGVPVMPRWNKPDKASPAPVTDPSQDRGTLATDHGTGVGAGDAVVHKTSAPNAVVQADGEFDMLAPPADCKSNRDCRDWYIRNCGHVPEVKGSLRKERPKVPVPRLRKLGASDAVSRTVIEQATDTGVKELPAKAAEVTRQTRDEPKHIPQVPGPTPDASADLVSPDLTQSELNALSKGLLKMPTIVKYLDQVGEEMPSPEIASEMETNRKSLNAQIGLDGGFERWHNMPRKWLMNLAGISRKGAVLLLEEYRYNFLKLNAAHNELLKKTGTQASQPVATATGPQKPAVAPATAPASPATSPVPASTPSKTPAPVVNTSSFSGLRIERRKRA